MAEDKSKELKRLYGEVKGILNVLPTSDKSGVSHSIGEHFNSLIDELDFVDDTDYSRLKLADSDTWPYGSKDLYDPVAIRSKVSSAVTRLEEDYGFGSALVSQTTAPIVVTMNNSQEVTVSVTPIQQIIDETDDADIKMELENLKKELQTSRNPKTISKMLNALQEKSWEVFIKILPFVLEHMGQKH
ncbi:MAG TPA: hypothetical protein VFH37_03470 [Candidatus Saccharimonadales bacterium]|nr:hypothetical protein [Candidatus Saccharimonadales bacterium]